MGTGKVALPHGGKTILPLQNTRFFFYQERVTRFHDLPRENPSSGSGWAAQFSSSSQHMQWPRSK
jgi:hypothetical protein